MVEEALIAQHLSGDSAAFDALVAQYQDRLFSLALRMLGNHEDAQDAVQEILLRMLRALPAFRGEARFSTWLYRLAANVCMDCRRHQYKGGVKVELVPELDQTGASEPGPEGTMETACTSVLIDRALKQLPVQQRLLIVLSDREELGNAEVADILGIGQGTLKSRLHRARQALRRVLERGVAIDPANHRHRLRMDETGTIV